MTKVSCALCALILETVSERLGLSFIMAKSTALSCVLVCKTFSESIGLLSILMIESTALSSVLESFSEKIGLQSVFIATTDQSSDGECFIFHLSEFKSLLLITGTVLKVHPRLIASLNA